MPLSGGTDIGTGSQASRFDVWVPRARRYADPATCLYTSAQWAPRRDDYCRLVGKPSSAVDALEQGKEELHVREELEETLANVSPDDTGTVRLDDDDHLAVPPPSAEDLPAEAKILMDELAGMLAVRADRLAAHRIRCENRVLGLLHRCRRPQVGQDRETRRNSTEERPEMTAAASGE
jgi:hypothetical protein